MFGTFIQFCPACGERIAKRREGGDTKWWNHLENCGVVVSINNTINHEGDNCACGFENLSDGARMSEHIRVDPHDWPKLLVTRELSEM